jgi:hypothetical protein
MRCHQLIGKIGADIHSSGGCCGNALQAALDRGNEAVASLLVMWGAKLNTEAVID